MTRSIFIVHTTSDFRKSYRKLPRYIQVLADKKDLLFRQDAFNPRLRTHKLKGELNGYFSYSIHYAYRILFRFIGDNEVIYYDIGTHEIYK